MQTKAETTFPDADFQLRELLLDASGAGREKWKRSLSQLSRERINKPLIYVGMGSCGLAAGAEKTLRAVEEYLREHQLDAHLVEGGCVGLCSMEPIVDVQLPGKARLSVGRITAAKVSPLLDEVMNNKLPDAEVLGQYLHPLHQSWPKVPGMDEHPFYRLQNRQLLAHCGLIDPVSLEEYVARGGYHAFSRAIANLTPLQVCQMMENSGLAGRGGGAFPTGKKWMLTLQTSSEQKYMVCNAAESDPGSYMNRAIMESNPHRLIEAVLIAAYATGASKAYVFIRREFTLAVKRLKAALEQAAKWGLTGHHILDSGVNIDIILKESARAFVCGEETALLNSIEGKRAMPASKPPYPATRGLWNQPTSVNNVETLFNVPLIVENGPEWYAGQGSHGSRGTKLFSLSGKTRYQGIIEVPMGISCREILEQLGGGMASDQPFKAILLGINSGSCIVEKTLDTPIAFEALQEIGAALGSGAFVVLDESTCMLDLARYFTRFFKKESCGKCIPCREGTARMLDIIEQAAGRGKADSGLQPLERFKGIMQLRNLARVMQDTSLCALGRSAPHAVLNTLNYFKQEFDSHVFERKCPAGVCRDLRTYFIDVEACTGCMACYRKCPVQAIIGSERQPHFIVQDKCIACGTCFDVCKFNAVRVTSSNDSES